MPFRFAWLSTGMADPASWHITLANAALLRSTPSLEGNTTAEFDTNLDSMKYYTQSLESISVRLKGLGESDSVSEGLVVAVTGFVCHDGAVGNFERMSIHMKGLKRIVEKRGGLENLNSPILRLMISWLDLSAATFLNERPYFNVPKGSITEIDTGDDTKYLDILLQSWHYKCPALGDIVSAIKVTAAVAVYINKHSHDDKFWTDDIMMARLLGPASYEILTLEGRPLPNNPSDPGYSGVAAREAFRRAALIFLADVKIRGQARAWELPKHLDAFRQISQLPLVDWAVVPELSLWAHVIAAIQEETAGRALHVATILGIMEILGLRTGSRAIVVVKGIIWVDSIMADKAAVLCEEIDYHRGVNELSQRLQNAPLDPQLEDFNADQFLPT
ncbi:hypothetical protein BJ170DRAFT_255918 [Xylariales sp. AK1849]|nr:hypothetical protein BJ170DRAFT_255918 [Xylariales sp. AK1849]